MTQTNTIQNKEELEVKDILENFATQVSLCHKRGVEPNINPWADLLITTIKHDKSISQAHQSGIEEERNKIEKIRETAGIVWVCPQCATKFFNRIFTVDTNIYTQTNMDCDCCKEERPCMHINSYGKPKE